MKGGVRLLWVLVVLSLLGGGTAVALTARARSASQEELRDMNKRVAVLEEEAKGQPKEIVLLRQDWKERIRLATQCLGVIVVQGRALNRLLPNVRAVPSRSELDRLADEVRDLELVFRQLLENCEGT